MKTWSRVAVLLLLVCGCAAHSNYLQVRSEIDETFFYYEQDRLGNKHGVSAVTWEADTPTRVPYPALVDIDSTIHILVKQQRRQTQGDMLSSGSKELLAEKDAMKALLVQLDRVIVARQRALNAYRVNDEGRFIEARREFGEAMGAFIADLGELYPDRASEEYKQLSRAAKDKTMATLRSLLQARLDLITAEDRALLNETESRRTTLRLQAFIDRPGKEKTPLHLKGYDKLPEGQLQVRDRQGLNLSDAEKERLNDQIRATSQLAQTLNQVRYNELSLKEGLLNTLPLMSEDLAKCIAEIDGLTKRLKDRERLDRIQDAFEKFVSKAQATAADLTDETRAKIAKMPTGVRAELVENSNSVVHVLETLATLKDLQYRWSHLRNPEELVGLLTDTSEVARNVNELIEEPGWPHRTMVDVTDLVLQKVNEFENEARVALRETITSDEGTVLVSELRGVYTDIQSGVQVVEEVLRLLRIGDVQPISATPEVPEVFDVDIANLEDTHLDLKRVAGQPNDLITLTATLKEQGRAERTSEASFKLTRYGWYGKLSPSVVLVRPDQLEEASESFQFAPVVSWNHHYRPRPENAKWYAVVTRGLQPAVGIHAAFLPYDPDNNVEIGLGTTLAFWDDRLQFGAGYNLMAESSKDGRFYFFVGSDLIGLLQTIGIGK
jgi:hypothetical protein